MEKFDTFLEEFADQVREKFQSTISGEPEAKLDTPLDNLLENIGRNLNLNVSLNPESRVEKIGAKPDRAVGVNEALTGYIELKKPGLGANPKSYSKRNREQWEKFKSLPNLIYTDGNEWGLYRSGERQKLIRFDGNITEDGKNAINSEAKKEFSLLIQDFLNWEPITPSSPEKLAELIAPLTRLLRDEVLEALNDETSKLFKLAQEWREVLFPDADDVEFADSYAQTVTYGLLLARFEGTTEVDLTINQATVGLSEDHTLLSKALMVLEQAQEEISLSLDLLERIISAVQPGVLQDETAESDPWLYFYEDFLSAYDPELRKDRGVYITPLEVVKAQTKLTGDILKNEFDQEYELSDEEVVAIDPGVGTGTYLLYYLEHALMRVEEKYGEGSIPEYAQRIANNLYGFEILVGPYTVARLRLTEALKRAHGKWPEDSPHIYLTDTLDSPYADTSTEKGLFYKTLSQEHEKATRIKREEEILICLGNPPYDRQQGLEEEHVERKGGWVRYGDKSKDSDPIFKDFTEPAKEANASEHLKNLYNDYVYFWRWALWKIFEKPKGPGIISFITASSYLKGPGYLGMREYMRKVLDKLWIIDLGGDSKGARKSENVFNIQTPVAIALGVRSDVENSEDPAEVKYTKIEGTEEEKLEALERINQIEELDWKKCFKDWKKPFLPESQSQFGEWPDVRNIFPWQHSGVQYKRTWPIAEKKKLLEKRWGAFLEAEDRSEAFRETSDRTIHKKYKSHIGDRKRLSSLASLGKDAAIPPVVHYGFRSFDRQWAIADARLCSRIRPGLWRSYGENQIFMTSLLTKTLGHGPAATVTDLIPDMDHFSGRGGKDVIPLWRISKQKVSNITRNLLSTFENQYGSTVNPADLFSYVYAVLHSSDYVRSFFEELKKPGPRVPITKDFNIFEKTRNLGKELIYLHTFGERFESKVEINIEGQTKCLKSITKSDTYPHNYEYIPEKDKLIVGDGEFGPLGKEVWEFSMSEFNPLKSWLSYRMKGGAGRKTSPLDDIRPSNWTAKMTEELLELTWVLEQTLGIMPDLNDNLSRIISSETFRSEELPEPKDKQKRPPTKSELDSYPMEKLIE